MSRLAILLVLAFALPLSAAEQVIRVADFGAIPNDGKDDTAGLQAAVEKCRGADGARVVFAKGRYDLTFEDAKQPAGLLVRGCRNLTIDGNGAELVCRGLASVLVFRDVAGLTVRKLAIDWARPPFSVGTVLAVGAKTIDVEIEKEFPVVGGEAVEAFMDYDPATRTPARRGLDIYDQVDSTELVRPQVLRLKLKKDVKARAGMLLVLRHNVYRFNGLDVSECRDVLIEDVTVYATPGMGLHGSFVTNATVRRLKVIPRPGTARPMSATADAMHFNCCYGSISISDSEFAGMGDDALNVHGMFLTVTSRVDGRTVQADIRNKWIMSPRPGDRIELTDPATLLPYQTVTVGKVSADNKSGMHRVEFAEPLPDRLAVGHVLGNVSWAPKLRVTGCTVRNNRARGFLVQTRDAVIDSNRFEGCTGAGLHITADCHYWKESIGTRGVTIRNNVFDGCNRGAAAAEAVINVFAHVKDYKQAPHPGVHRDLVIEGNQIRNSDRSAIFVGSTDGFVVRNNRIERCCDSPNRAEGRNAIYVLNSRNGKIEGNQVPADMRGRQQESDVKIGPGCDAASIAASQPDR